MTLYFYKVNEEYGCFSNFSKHGFELDGKYWNTSGHYFQVMKFEGTELVEKIRLTSSPMEAAKIVEMLISTRDIELIEKTTNDYYWGCGTDDTGKNMLGKIIMEVR